jgi:hypothetical protein
VVRHDHVNDRVRWFGARVIRSANFHHTVSYPSIKMALLETPSRIWRRIEADEQNDMPSLPEVPAFEDSNDVNATTTSEESHQSALQPTSPLQSTPAPLSVQNTIRLQSSTSSTTRFAQSITSRASRSGSGFSSSTGSLSRRSRPSISSPRSEPSFDDISAIPFCPQPNVAGVDEAGVDAGEDGLDDDMSLAEALRPSNRSGSPFPLEGMAGDGHSKYSYSVSLRSEPKVCTVPRLSQNRHEHNYYRRAPSTRCGTYLFEDPYLASVHPLSRARFPSHRPPRIPHLIPATHLDRRNWTELHRLAWLQSLLQTILMRASLCH